MADNSTLPATGDVIATDDVAGVKYQRVKLVDGTLDSTTAIGGDATNGLDVDVTRVQGTVTVAGTATVTGNKAEDAAAADGDAGLPVLGVRNDSATARTSTDGDYGMVALDSAGRVGITDLGGAISIDDNSGSITVDGTVAVSGTVAVTDNSGSLTVDNGGTFAVQATLAAGATNIAKAEDVASADADVGVPAMGVRKATPANTSGTDGDYEMLQLSAGRLWVSATVDAALPAGANAIGKLAANSGVDIGALTANQTVNVAQVNGVTTTMGNGASGTGVQRVTLASDSTGNIATIGTSVVPGTAATNLGKAEDAVAADGDTGVMALAVRTDTPTTTTNASGDYHPLLVGARGEQWVGLVGHDTTLRVTATSSGLTTSTTAYVTGDMLGGEMSLTSAVRISGGRGVIESVTLVDASDIIGAVDVLFFSAASTPAADNAAASWSDANLLNLVGYISLPNPLDLALNRVAYLPCAIPFQCAATTLFASLITRTGHTFFGAGTDLTLAVQIRQE